MDNGTFICHKLGNLVQITQTGMYQNAPTSSLRSVLFAILKLNWINGTRRHLLLRLVCIQLFKRHVFLRHHRSSILVTREVRLSSDLFDL
jgi:hypothetical protein